MREKAYKWLAKEVLPQLPPERTAQLAPALADPGGVAVQGIRSEPWANEQNAALALLQAALALCPPAWLSDRCWASADMLAICWTHFAHVAHACLALGHGIPMALHSCGKVSCMHASPRRRYLLANCQGARCSAYAISHA